MNHCKQNNNAKKKFENAFNKEKREKKRKRKEKNINIRIYITIKTRQSARRSR